MRRSAREAGWEQMQPVPYLLSLGLDIGVYQKDLDEKAYPGGHLTVLSEPTSDGFHLSISHRYHPDGNPQAQPGRYPTWDEIKEAWTLFCPRGRDFAMLFPGDEKRWVNHHETTFHLWEIVVASALGLRAPAEVRLHETLHEIDGTKERA